MAETKRKVSLLIFLGLIGLGAAALALSGCEFFNVSVPDYLEKYSSEAGADEVALVTAYESTSLDGFIKADYIIRHDTESRLEVRLWNPRSHYLSIEVYKYDFGASAWEASAIVGTNPLSPTHTDSKSVDYRLVYDGEKSPATFHFTINSAVIGDKYQFKFVIRERDYPNREFGSIESPLIYCNVAPTTPTLATIPVAVSSNYNHATWSIADATAADYENAVSMRLDLKQFAGTGSNNIDFFNISGVSRTYKAENNKWVHVDEELDFTGNAGAGNFRAKFPDGFVHDDITAADYQQFRIRLYNELGQYSEAKTRDFDANNLSTVYVGGSGADDGNAGFSSNAPLATIEQALIILQASNGSDPKIVLLGDLGAGYNTSGIDAARRDGNSMVSIKGFSSPSSKLTIIGNGKTLDVSLFAVYGGKRGLFSDFSGNLVIEGLSIKGADVSTLGLDGGGIYYSGTGTLTLGQGVVIKDNKAVNGGGICLTGGGTCLIGEDVNISNNVANGTNTPGISEGGGGICVKAGTLNMTGGAITNNEGHDGAGVLVKGGVFNLTGDNALISVNKASSSGGGVHVRENGVFRMTSGLISANTAESAAHGGGGVAAADAVLSLAEDSFTMTGGTISENNATNGGGVLIFSRYNTQKVGVTIGGTAVISRNWARLIGDGKGGGISLGTTDNGSARLTITGNAAVTSNGTMATSRGGGIYIYTDVSSASATLTMTGGTISGNTAAIDGGGIYARGNSTVNFTRGDIGSSTLPNKAKYGGGVYLNASTFNMSGDSAFIKGNKAIEADDGNSGGGGVHIFTGTMTLSAGEISGNHADFTGGGIFLNTGGTLSMTGGAVKTNAVLNTGHGAGISSDGGTFKMGSAARVDTDNEIWLATDKFITITSNFTGTGTVGKIEPESYTGSPQVLYGSLVAANYNRFSVVPQTDGGGTVEWFISQTGKLYSQFSTTVTTIGDLKTAVEQIPSGSSGTITVNAATLTLAATITVAGNVTLVTPAGSPVTIIADETHPDALFSVTSTGKLTLGGTSSGGLTIDGGATFDANGNYSHGRTAQSAMITVVGQLVIDDNATLQNNNNRIAVSPETITYGGAVRITDVNASITINGGTIKNNYAQYGGGVDCDGIFYMYSGVVENNYATGGAGLALEGTSIISGDARISGNIATGDGGGGIRNNGGNHTISGTVSIYGNKAPTGGGIYLRQTAKVTISESVDISANEATNGGGVYIGPGYAPGDATLVMNGGTIGDVAPNTVTSKGAGIYMESNNYKRLILSGNVLIKDLVYLSNGQVITVGGSLIPPTGDITAKIEAPFNPGTVVLQGNGESGSEHILSDIDVRRFRLGNGNYFAYIPPDTFYPYGAGKIQ